MPPTLVKIHVWLRIIILAGIALFLLMLIAGGIYALATRADWGEFRAFFSAISLSRERLTAAASPAATPSGGKIKISWTHEKKSGEGIYELLYPCRPGVNVILESKETITCNSSYSLNDRSSLAIIPYLTANQPVDIPFTVAFTPKNAARVSLYGIVTVTVNPPKEDANRLKTATTTEAAGQNSGNRQPVAGDSSGGLQPGPKTAKAYPVAAASEPTTAPNPNGYPDLAIKIIETGYLIGEVFIKSASVAPGQRAAVVFEIKNIGTDTSPAWNFRANLPVPGGDFTSETQTALAPGEKVGFTIGFDNLRDAGSNTAKILVDPDGRIFRDPNRLNNEATVAIYRTP